MIKTLSEQEIKIIAKEDAMGCMFAVDKLHELRPEVPEYYKLSKQYHDNEDATQEAFWGILESYGVDLDNYFALREE